MADLELLVDDGRSRSSPVLAWLPLCLALSAATIVASAFCPVPRSTPVLPLVAWKIAARFLAAVTATGSVVLLVSACLADRRSLRTIRILLPRFVRFAAWIAPVAAFYARSSVWAAILAVPLASLAVAVLQDYHQRHSDASQLDPDGTSTTSSLAPKFVAALLLQLAAVCLSTQHARAASLLLGLAASLIFWFRTQLLPPQPATARWSLQSMCAVTLLAYLFVAASFAPYLALKRPETSGGSETTSEKPSAAPKSQPSASLSLALLLTLFGHHEASPEPWEAAGNRGRNLAITLGETYKGMILRPEIKDAVTLVPPPPSRRIFDNKPGRQSSDPVSIPFYGAYWFFRASDKTLPKGAVESRGEPSSVSFRTTDYSPMTMEARQNFGTLIDLACCKAIQLVILNADRRPNTVAIELIVRNTRLADQPEQSLGLAHVTSTRRWIPGENKPPAAEVLTFHTPPQSPLLQFDEVIVRYQLRSPRRTWSARISIDKFRFIPREF